MRQLHAQQPDEPPRRFRTGVSVLRSAAVAVLMVVGYYQAPLDRPLDARVAVWLALGLLALAGALVWQVRAITRSGTPRLQAIQAVAVGLPFLLLLYASTYCVMSVDRPASFTEELGRTDALYFTLSVFTTVGLGDIAPASEAARILTMTQMVVGLVAVGAVARILLGAVQVAVDHKDRAAGHGPTPRISATDRGPRDG
jgi:voltage-gated potassium channel